MIDVLLLKNDDLGLAPVIQNFKKSTVRIFTLRIKNQISL